MRFESAEAVELCVNKSSNSYLSRVFARWLSEAK